ncbi:MAG: hypothetical protein GX216_10140 [Methanomicrobiales archaeon]|nr:hypothetical protein [Methanomicrobiales archaeon]
MIPIVEIKEAARIFGVPPSTIERDYAQNWLLAHLGALPMALKGGTGIRKVFIESYRFSDDLDFTLLEPCEKEILKEKIVDAVSRAREESGIRFEEDISIIETTTGFRATSLFRTQTPHILGNISSLSFSTRSRTFFGTSVICLSSPRSTA